MVQKSARKFAKKPRGRPFTGKNDPRRGRGPAKGQGGRPPNEFKAWCQGVMESVPQAGVGQPPYKRTGREELLRLAFRAADERVRLNALRYIGAHAYGEPQHILDVGTEDRPFVIKVIDEYPDGTRRIRQVERKASAVAGLPGAVH